MARIALIDGSRSSWREHHARDHHARSNEVVVVYIGRITPPSQQKLEQYPELRTEPAIELAPTKTLRSGARYASLYVIAPGFIGYTDNRVPAKVEQPLKNDPPQPCSPPRRPLRPLLRGALVRTRGGVGSA